MQKIIEPECVLAYILTKKPEVSVKQLKQIRDIVLENNPGIIIDISRQSVNNALLYYPTLFKEIDEENMQISSIQRNKEFYDFKKYIDNILLSKLDKSLTSLLDKGISQVYQ